MVGMAAASFEVGPKQCLTSRPMAAAPRKATLSVPQPEIGGVYSSESAMRHDKETEHTSYTMQ